MEEEQIYALTTVLNYVELQNKNDEDLLVAQAATILQKFLEEECRHSSIAPSNNKK